ncbi:MAG TPA: aminofutalosine synthase MqnE [Armatimonadota bacterium]|nr:aminofutalosine synthase MqnE [Armatimonadota bacterium]
MTGAPTVVPDPGLADIEARVLDGGSVTRDEIIRLYESDDLFAIGRMANHVRERLNGNRAYYIINRHINPTNVCINRCRFCAFSRSANAPDAYTLSLDEIRQRAEACQGTGVTEIHVVGGLHPDLPFDYYVDLLRTIRAALPEVHIQAFTAVEVAYLSRLAGMPVRDTLRSLREAGLDSLPGGGAEVFAERVRAELCPDKLPGAAWLDVMRTAHELGIRSNATLLYGHIETAAERADHLLALRELQDETGGFLSFIPLAFHAAHTDMPVWAPTSALDDLKALAVGRIALDNFAHIKAFWIMLTPKLAQVALSFGVDDIDGTVVEEKITHAAGADTPQALTRADLEGLIREAGREPVERDTLYNEVRAR